MSGNQKNIDYRLRVARAYARAILQYQPPKPLV